jgi:GDPmannose 4,6-dehydratase
VAGLRPDVIVNLGGLSSVAVSRQPALTAQLTWLAVLELLEAAWRLHDRGHPVWFLQASSADIFGEAEEGPQSEPTPIRPISPYGPAKRHATGMYLARGLPASTVTRSSTKA